MRPSSEPKLSFLLALAFIVGNFGLVLVEAQNKSFEEIKPKLKTNSNRLSTSATPTPESVTKAYLDDIESSPTVTSSLHQVWTSSSSDDLSELSPEVISKLRADVPFLAAYALRPRLVGGASPLTKEDLLSAKKTFDLGNQKIASNSQSSPLDVLVGEQSSKLTRRSSSDPLAKLTNFNELKFEYSSSSKSEHHHKRSTTLKRKSPNQKQADELRRKVLATTSQLMKRRREKSTKNSNKQSKFKKRQLKVGHSTRNEIRTGRLRNKMVRKSRQHHLNIIKHGRLSKANEEGDVKGGSPGDKKQKPFYGNKKQETEGGTNNFVNDIERRPPNASSSSTGPSTSSKTPIQGDGNNLEPDYPIDEELPPKRVGDDDVEEGGDTVTVEPKFDGVDDDPQIDEGGPVEDNDDPSLSTDGNFSSVEREDDGKPENDERNKRVGRDKPNSSPSSEGGASIGGGIGTATGSGGSADASPMSKGDGNIYDEDNHDHADRASDQGNDVGAGRGRESSVEFADDEQDKNPTKTVGSDDRSSTDGARPSSEAAEDEHDGLEGDNERRTKSRGEAAKGLGIEQDSDLDYRDDMEIEKKSRKASSEDCNDNGAYNHDDGHDHHHHDHKKWLQEAIPGEPNIDYPTLSRVNSSNFNCRHQKYPGFYADTESRCQVFHICQPDGRQDSFL